MCNNPTNDERYNFKNLCYEKIVKIPNNIQKSKFRTDWFFKFQTRELICRGNKIINNYSENEIRILDLATNEITHRSISHEGEEICWRIYGNLFLNGLQQAINIIDIEKSDNHYQKITTFNLTEDKDAIIASFDCFNNKIYVQFDGGMVKSFLLNDLMSCTDETTLLPCTHTIEPIEKYFWDDDFSPGEIHGKHLFKVASNKVHIWDLENNLKIGTIKEETQWINYFYVKDNLIFLECNSQKLTIWNLDTCKKLNLSLENVDLKEGLYGMQVYDDKLFCAINNGPNLGVNITIWNVDSGKKIGSIELPSTFKFFQYCNNKLFVSTRIDSIDELTIYDFAEEEGFIINFTPSYKKRKRDL